MVELLRARGLVHDYGRGERALDGVDVELRPGELVCVLGPNGSGKSTLLRILNGVLRPTGGSVELDGRDLRVLGARERAKQIAAVPQVIGALPDAVVEDFVLGGRYPYLGLFGKTRSGDHEAVRSALEEADAYTWRDRRLGELSGGECQRVLVARALAQEAGLLLFDEPTSALDPEHQVLLFQLFVRLVRDKDVRRAALVATHELALASRFADRIVLMEGGRIVADGPATEILVPEILVPVYGPNLYFGQVESTLDSERLRPVIVPWPAEGGSDAD